MNHPRDLPPQIGPHEGRELELMLAGKKPLAMFSDILESKYPWPDSEFEPHVASGALVKRELLRKTQDGRYTFRHLYYALATEEWRIDKAHALSLKHYDVPCPEAAQDCVELGRLLGYSEAEIQCFIDWARFPAPVEQR